MNIGTISDDFQVKIVNKANHRLGEVEEGFLAALQPGEAFTIGGRAVVLERLHMTTAVVKPAQGERSTDAAVDGTEDAADRSTGRRGTTAAPRTPSPRGTAAVRKPAPTCSGGSGAPKRTSSSVARVSRAAEQGGSDPDGRSGSMGARS